MSQRSGRAGGPSPRWPRPVLECPPMLFPTVDFAIFFCLVFLGHWLLNARPVPWKLFMIGSSYVFYAWWDWHFVWLLAGVSLVAQVGGLAVAKQQEPVRRRLVMA